MRLVSRAFVALVVLHLDSLAELAIFIYEQIVAALGAFWVNMAAVCSPFNLGLTEDDEAGLMKEFVSRFLALHKIKTDCASWQAECRLWLSPCRCLCHGG